MKQPSLRFVAALTTVVTLAIGELRAAPATATLPAPVRRVVFLGDSITYSGVYVSTVAAYFATRHPGRVIEFIDVGLSSETVSGLSEDGHAQGKFPRPDLHERLGRVLAQTKPDLVFACYGMNDGVYLPFAEDRFRKFRDGIAWLHEQVVATGAGIIHVTPPPFDERRGGKAGYAAVLDRYSDWLIARRASDRWEVVDLHFPLQRFAAERRKQEPEFFLAKDGVHQDELGHWLMAREILRHLGARDLEQAMSAAAMAAAHPQGAKILSLIVQRHVLTRDAWLSATGHQRPGVKAGMPLSEASAQAAEIDAAIARLKQG
ncbi:MAG: G-D-S-L family lipolytic protein [Opitutus sp.]|nr:G-D-S-L family lipolytic protein [Opitutus sp.]